MFIFHSGGVGWYSLAKRSRTFENVKNPNGFDSETQVFTCFTINFVRICLISGDFEQFLEFYFLFLFFILGGVGWYSLANWSRTFENVKYPKGFDSETLFFTCFTIKIVRICSISSDF